MKSSLLSIALTCVFAIGGCAGETSSESTSPTPSESSAPSQSPTPSPTEPLKRVNALINCTQDFEGDDVQVVLNAVLESVLEDAWSEIIVGDNFIFSGKYDCFINRFESSDDYEIFAFTEKEFLATEVAGYYGYSGPGGSVNFEISTLYRMCVDLNELYFPPWSGNKDYEQEASANAVRAAFLLCPDHPSKDDARERIANIFSTQRTPEASAFAPGNLRVGKQVAPGKYVPSNSENCYWERQNSAGKILEDSMNRTLSDLSVSIEKSDYAFFSANCGDWELIEE